MKIHALRIRNFLSFTEFEWPDIAAGLNVIVGPNGSGKTNLLGRCAPWSTASDLSARTVGSSMDIVAPGGYGLPPSNGSESF